MGTPPQECVPESEAPGRLSVEPAPTLRTGSTGSPPIAHRDIKPENTQPVRLVVVPVDRLTSPDERFRCEPYSAVIRAAVCLTRQHQHGHQIALSGKNAGKVVRHGASGRRPAVRSADHGICRDCEIGRRVVSQLQPAAKDSPKGGDAMRCGRGKDPSAVIHDEGDGVCTSTDESGVAPTQNGADSTRR